MAGITVAIKPKVGDLAFSPLLAQLPRFTMQLCIGQLIIDPAPLLPNPRGHDTEPRPSTRHCRRWQSFNQKHQRSTNFINFIGGISLLRRPSTRQWRRWRARWQRSATSAPRRRRPPTAAAAAPRPRSPPSEAAARYQETIKVVDLGISPGGAAAPLPGVAQHRLGSRGRLAGHRRKEEGICRSRGYIGRRGQWLGAQWC